MDLNYKAVCFLRALELVRETCTEFKELHDGGLTFREVDEVVFGTEPGPRKDISGKVMRAAGSMSFMRHFSAMMAAETATKRVAA
jgi:hypothetical protein